MRAANDDQHGGREVVTVTFSAVCPPGPDHGKLGGCYAEPVYRITPGYYESPGYRFARGMLWGVSIVAGVLLCFSVGAGFVG